MKYISNNTNIFFFLQDILNLNLSFINCNKKIKGLSYINDALTFNTTSIVTMDYLIRINYHVILICIINNHFQRDAVCPQLLHHNNSIN
jgi:hypothetical protein